jgi:KDO2-lipid IV(A) lauroyltransferase
LKRAALVLAGAVARLPLWLSGSFRGAACALGSVVPSRRRRRCLANLALAFPERSEAWRRTLACRACTHAVREMLAMLAHSYRPRDRLASLCVNYAELRAVIERDRAQGKGVLIVGGHLGNPPLLAAVCATVAPVTGLIERYDFGPHHEFVRASRSRLGLQTVPNDEWPLDLLRALQRNEVVTFLPDVPPRRENGIPVPFFGAPVITTTFPAALARLTGCVSRPVYLVREASRYRAIIRDPLQAPRADEGEAGLAQATREWTAVLEQEIRARPEQWMWTMRRWSKHAATGDARPDARARVGRNGRAATAAPRAAGAGRAGGAAPATRQETAARGR